MPDLNAQLFHVAKLILAEEESDRTAELVFRHLLEATGADRGFIVVREGDTFREKLKVHFDDAGDAALSNSLVREAIETRAIVDSSALDDRQLALTKRSAELVAGRAVLVAPLCAGEEVFAVVYLEQLKSLIGFHPDAKKFLREFADVAALCIKRAIERASLVERNRRLERELHDRYDFEGIITQDARMLDVLRIVGQVADSDAPILILGETGTGKELIARALHVNSTRRDRPFVALHCAAFPGTLLESELFGHVRGAFTGAVRDRAGRIAAAEGGTLFLDELAEIAPEVQAKLLRFLQFGEIQRLGADATEKVDVRIVAATHQDLRSLIKEKKFRQDLYFRLKVIEVEVPPLRARRGDIPLLIEQFLRVSWKKPGVPRWTAEARGLIESWDYPGNVRELAHLVERACLLATGPELGVELLPAEMIADLSDSGQRVQWKFTELTNDELQAARDEAVAAVERTFLRALMIKAGGNISEAARISGLARSYLQKLVARHRDRLASG